MANPHNSDPASSPSNAANAASAVSKPSHVVCLGASAGGLDALERFFQCCPTDLGAAFVVIQHLSPDHKSMMNNLLSRHTGMPVVMVEEGMAMAANTLYLIPPGTVMHLGDDGTLHLTAKNPRGLTLPIDIFFTSLAEHCGSRTVGIILSGTGSDGTRGAEALSAAGAFLMAQEAESAKFDGMPRSAVATGLIDAVLPVEDLPERLRLHLRNLPVPPPPAMPREIPNADMPSGDVLAGILRALHQEGGIDFADYKLATVMRRIERRMQVSRTTELWQYLDLLETSPAERQTLRRELLISVTSFFRDAEAFELLAEKVIAPLVDNLAPDGSLRVWAAGVATGEEAYTLGMLFLEAFEKFRRWPNLKIFATDADPGCIEIAGNGQYPPSAITELSEERIERFFTRKGEAFVARNDLRQNIIFACHNLLTDPPFTRMDLVVCRNTLIYFKSGAQERAMRSLHYALRENGTLMLGSSESVSGFTETLVQISHKHKLFRRLGGEALPYLREGQARFSYRSGISAPAPRKPRRGRTTRAELAVSADIGDRGIALLMNRYCPPAVVVNAQHEVVHVYGDMAQFLQQREGTASLELSRQLPEPLVPVASALLFKTEREQIRLQSDPVRLRARDGSDCLVRLATLPMPPESEHLTLLCFEIKPALDPAGSPAVNIDQETIARVEILESELAATRENLQSTIEELETSNEELQATNEELLASNEELQSSNEELQSLNEEVITVNAEFQEKMLVLTRAHADLDSMARAAGVATVFLDEKLLITRFSPDAEQVFKLRAADTGRPLDEIAHRLDYPTLMQDIVSTLANGRLVEREITSLERDRIYLARILPYTVPSTPLRGVVVTFIDISAFHDARRLQGILDALPEHIAVLDTLGRIVLVNAAWRRFALANGDPSLQHTGVGCNYLDACRTTRDKDPFAAKAWQGLKQVLEGSVTGFTLEYPCHAPAEKRWFVMNVAPLRFGNYGAVISHVNISAWTRNDRQSHGNPP